MVGPRSRTVGALVLLIVATVSLPLAVGQEEPQGQPLVSQSLWGVKHSVGLTVVKEFMTNYGERAFYETRPSGQGVRIGVIDTGIDLSHPDLAGSIACGHCWRDLVSGQPEPYDDHGHGTHVAGILAGRGHLQANPLESYFPTGARGIAPEAGLIVAKAMNASGAGADARVAEAIEWTLDPDGDPATDDGADIVHLSLGIEAPRDDPVPGNPAVDAGSETEQAVQAAIEQGVFVVMSAGNQGNEEATPPAGVKGVIAVGALDGQGQVLSFSNRGENVDLFAPGVVTSTWPVSLDDDGIEDGYTGLAGTSQAAPVVTGALALAVEANPALAEQGGATKVAHIESLLVGQARPIDGEASAEAVDAEALVVSQDTGADAVSWGLVVVYGLIALAVIAVISQLILVGLARVADAQGHREAAAQPPRRGRAEGAQGEQGQGGGGDDPGSGGSRPGPGRPSQGPERPEGQTFRPQDDET